MQDFYDFQIWLHSSSTIVFQTYFVLFFSLLVLCAIISSSFVSFSLQHWYFCNKQLIFSFFHVNLCTNTTQAHTPVHTHILTHFPCLSKSPPFTLLLLTISVIHAHIYKENAHPSLCSLFFFFNKKETLNEFACHTTTTLQFFTLHSWTSIRHQLRKRKKSITQNIH